MVYDVTVCATIKVHAPRDVSYASLVDMARHEAGQLMPWDLQPGRIQYTAPNGQRCTLHDDRR